MPTNEANEITAKYSGCLGAQALKWLTDDIAATLRDAEARGAVKEREECAQIVEFSGEPYHQNIAAAIRARGGR